MVRRRRRGGEEGRGDGEDEGWEERRGDGERGVYKIYESMKLYTCACSTSTSTYQHLSYYQVIQI